MPPARVRSLPRSAIVFLWIVTGLVIAGYLIGIVFAIYSAIVRYKLRQKKREGKGRLAENLQGREMKLEEENPLYNWELYNSQEGVIPIGLERTARIPSWGGGDSLNAWL